MEEILLDDKDKHLLHNTCVNVASHGYVRLVKFIGKENGKYKYKQEYLHRLVSGAKSGEVVDHINRNKLDNRRENLRICTHAQNSRNKSRFGGRFKGVHKTSNNRWVAQITFNRRCKTIGSFRSEEDAAFAYDLFAMKMHKDFAVLNTFSQ